MAKRSHLFPFRTQKLSSFTSKILGWRRPGKIDRRRHLNAPLAQLVEQLTLNQWVLGSSPRWCTIRPVGQAVKTPASHAGNTSSILVRVTKFQVGAYCSEVTPVPIPNTEVKLIRVDDTWLETAWKSRSVPAQIFLLSSVGRALGC